MQIWVKNQIYEHYTLTKNKNNIYKEQKSWNFLKKKNSEN
jgi:hypothetical protein